MMRTQFTPMLLAALLASFSAQAQEAIPTTAPQATPSAAADPLPFGTGYEARQRQAKQARADQEQQVRDQTQVRDETQTRDRSQATADGAAAQTRTERSARDRSNATKESRRTERGQRGSRH